jgi:hypothetical protein
MRIKEKDMGIYNAIELTYNIKKVKSVIEAYGLFYDTLAANRNIFYKAVITQRNKEDNVEMFDISLDSFKNKAEFIDSCTKLYGYGKSGTNMCAYGTCNDVAITFKIDFPQDDMWEICMDCRDDTREFFEHPQRLGQSRIYELEQQLGLTS